MNTVRSNGSLNSPSGLLATVRSGQLTQPRGASSLTAVREQHLSKADTEAWLMVYLDVITLLLVFFILMLSSVNADLLGGISKVTEPMEHVAGEVEEDSPQPEPFAKTGGEVEEAEPDSAIHEKIHGEVTEAQPDLELAERLRESLAAHQLVEGLDIIVEPGQVNLQLPEQILFDTGQAELVGLADNVLRKIVPVLMENNFYISIEGHTDNVPIKTERFPSNWELSTARASTVIRYLNSQGIPIERMRAIGYADTQPVDSNDTFEGRRANRRVRLVIHVDQTEAPKPTPRPEASG
jgi:chemotaxis protein MotB